MTKYNSIETIRPENGIESQERRNLFDFIGSALAVLWKDWLQKMALDEMEFVTWWEDGFTLRGVCPYAECRYKTVFRTVASSYMEESANIGERRLVGVLRCDSCREYILGILRMAQDTYNPHSYSPVYEAHYPLAQPNIDLSEDIPADVAHDFKEAIKCHSAQAPRATIIMCRRALEISCGHLGAGAKSKSLDDKIKELVAAGKLNHDLEEMATIVRLGARAAAHLQEGDLSNVGDEDAEAMIEFTQDFLEQVHVAPAKRQRFMKKFDNRKASRIDKGES